MPDAPQKPDALRAFWAAYLATLPPDAPHPPQPEAWYFCDTEPCANELADLVLRGIKTATCSLRWVYEAEGEPVPQVGELSIVTTWDGDPVCIIETTEITHRPYNEVDARFAYDEGEGDRSLDYWRRAHWSFFSRECATLGRAPAEDMPLVCERFVRRYPAAE